MIERIYHNSSFYTKIRLPSLFSERYLIRWQPNHRTKLHGHNGKQCNFYLLKGAIVESRYKLNDRYYKTSSKTLNTIFDMGYIDDTMGKHVLHNVSNKPSYTYHFYKNISN